MCCDKKKIGGNVVKGARKEDQRYLEMSRVPRKIDNANATVEYVS